LSQIRLYFDEDAMDGDVVRGVRARGIDATTAVGCRMIRRDDEEHLAFAAAQGRTLVSFNVSDFHELHTAWLSAGRDHAGVILGRQKRYSIGEQIRRLVRLIGSLTAEEMRNREEFLARW